MKLTVFLVFALVLQFGMVASHLVTGPRFRTHPQSDLVAERPQRPGKTFMEKFFFDGLKHMHKKVKAFPQTVLVKVPFPGVPIYEANRDKEIDGRKVRTKVYEAVEKIH